MQVALRVTAKRSPQKRRPRQSIIAIEQPTDAATAAQALPADGAAPARPTDAALLSDTEGVSGSAADGCPAMLQQPEGDDATADMPCSDADGTNEGSCDGAVAEQQLPPPLSAVPQPSEHNEETAGQVSTMMEQMIQRVDAARSSASGSDHPGSDGQTTTSEVSAEEPAAGCADIAATQAAAAVVLDQAAEDDMAASAEVTGNVLDQRTGSDAPAAAERTDQDEEEQPMAANHMHAADDDTAYTRQTSADAAEDSVAAAAPSAPEPEGVDGADMHTTAAMDRCGMCSLACSRLHRNSLPEMR